MFDFMETSFFISLGITFVLILLLVYHFKQRLSVAEGKQDTMFEIINNLAQELTNVKAFVLSHERPLTPYPKGLYTNNNGPTLSDNMKCAITEECCVDENESESNDEIDSDDESESDGESDSDDESESDGEKIVVSDADEDNLSVDIIQPSTPTNIETVKESDVIVEVTRLVIDTSPNFSKMTLGALKTYITERGWVDDASKMKKAQILELIENHAEA
jgi:hypothetical protein